MIHGLKTLKTSLGRTPSRGAWIEIIHQTLIPVVMPVAPPRGVRGLKYMIHENKEYLAGRTPSRGAWIEMTHSPQILQHDKSHPLAGCVD